MLITSSGLHVPNKHSLYMSRQHCCTSQCTSYIRKVWFKTLKLSLFKKEIYTAGTRLRCTLVLVPLTLVLGSMGFGTGSTRFGTKSRPLCTMAPLPCHPSLIWMMVLTTIKENDTIKELKKGVSRADLLSFLRRGGVLYMRKSVFFSRSTMARKLVLAHSSLMSNSLD